MVMKRRELAPGIIVYSDVIEDFENLVKDIEEGAQSAGIEWVQSSVRKGDNVEVDTEYRDTMIISFEYIDSVVDDFVSFQDAFYLSLSNMFFSAFSPLELDYKLNYQIETTNHERYSLLKYGKGQKFVNHIDDHKDYNRKVSLVYYINDDYTGGEIVFPRFNLTYKPLANELILFPSNYVYNHSVLPVIDGTRYAVVSWMS
jgi:hypothetical protein